MPALAPVIALRSPAGAQPNDPKRFVDLVADHDRRLRALARRLLQDDGLVDDALQEAYLRAFQALPGFRGEASLGTWLYRIVHNTCMDELRRGARRAAHSLDQDASDIPAPDAGDWVAERADLAAALAELPNEQRTAVMLVDGYGVDYATAARVLKIPAGTVGSRVSRARAVLRHRLASTPCNANCA